MSLAKILLDFARAELFPALIAHLLVEAGAGRLRPAARSIPQTDAPRFSPRPRVKTASPSSPVTVLSNLPGRARLRVAGLRDNPASAEAVSNALRSLPGVRAAKVDPLTGSALLRYDPAHLTLPEIQSALTPLGMAGSRA
jgi:copper chaperone CopZ